MTKPFRIFISAVSSEFATARAALASDLRARGLEVKFQEDFRQEAGTETTLQKLERYIRDCDAVVALMGSRSGSLPPPAAAAPFASMLLSGIAEASYTQWEILFARHYQRRLSFYVAGPHWIADRPAAADDRPELQAALRHRLFVTDGLDRGEMLDTADAMCRAVLREAWPSARGQSRREMLGRLLLRLAWLVGGALAALLVVLLLGVAHYEFLGRSLEDSIGRGPALLLLPLAGILGGLFGWWKSGRGVRATLEAG